MLERTDTPRLEGPLLAALLDETREPVLALDDDGTILHANAAAAAAFERADSDLAGMRFTTLLERGERPRFLETLAEASPEAVTLYLAVGAGGSASVSLRELAPPPRRVVSVAVAAAHERPPDTGWQTDVMRDFVRNAAHQLRTPLTGIVAAVEVLMSGAKDNPADCDRFLLHIDNHARRLTRLARGLLVLARAESGEPVRVDVVELLPLLQEIAGGTSPRPGVIVTVACEPTLAAVLDPDLAREALASIVDNAVEHTREGAIRLEAAAAADSVWISVTDSGGGIAPEHRARIFEPFYRPAATGEGYGLGLAIAAKAVQAMGGRVEVDDVGGGTRFTVHLLAGRDRS